MPGEQPCQTLNSNLLGFSTCCAKRKDGSGLSLFSIDCQIFTESGSETQKMTDVKRCPKKIDHAIKCLPALGGY